MATYIDKSIARCRAYRAAHPDDDSIIPYELGNNNRLDLNLRRLNIEYYRQLATLTYNELEGLPGVGQKHIEVILGALVERGYTLDSEAKRIEDEISKLTEEIRELQKKRDELRRKHGERQLCVL